MRKISAIMLVTVLPAFAADSPPATPSAPAVPLSIPLGKGLQFDFNGEIVKQFTALQSANAGHSPLMGRKSTCYFIRQVNKNLHKPNDKPSLQPLADVRAAPISNSDLDCLSDSVVRRTSGNVR